MYFDFRPLLRGTFAELSRKYPYSQTPAISRGRIEGKANARGLGVWLSQSLTFGNLAAAFGACFLRLKKASLGSDSGTCFRTMVFGCAREASPLEARLLLKGNVIVQKHHHTGNWTRTKPKFSGALLLPDPRRQWVAALYIMIIIFTFRETFANKNVTFANSNIFFARVPNITWTVFAIKTLCKDLSIDYHLYIYVCVYDRNICTCTQAVTLHAGNLTCHQILHMHHDNGEHLVSKICKAWAAGGKGWGLVFLWWGRWLEGYVVAQLCW